MSQPAACHVLPKGSRGAIGLVAEYLTQEPSDLGVRWLLKLACFGLTLQWLRAGLIMLDNERGAEINRI